MTDTSNLRIRQHADGTMTNALCSLCLCIGLILYIFFLQQVAGLRVRMFPEEEPTSKVLHSNYRFLLANPNYYYMKSAGVLEDEDIDQVFKDQVGVKQAHKNFKFNSGKYLEQANELKWFIPYDERSALQVFDDPRDRDLAAGPQVDQELCGLQLDYMHHLAKNYRTNVVNSTEYSIYRVLDTYDWPRYSLMRGNNYFLGDYRGCIDSRLNVVRRELSKINKVAAEKYFEAGHNEPLPERHPVERWLIDNIGPYFGRPRKNRGAHNAMRRHKDQLRALPMRYCLAGVRWPQWSNSSHMRRNVVIRTGVCLPETCDSNSLALHNDKIKRLMDLQSSDFYSGYYINDLYCLPDEQSELRNPFRYSGTVALMVFNVLWLILLILALLFKYKKREEISSKEEENLTSNWRMYLNNWSLKRNALNFVAPLRGRRIEAAKKKSANGMIKTVSLDLEPLEGFKVFSSYAVIVSHITIVVFAGSWNTDQGHKLLTRSWPGMVLTVCPAVVDNFFVVTGFLTSCTLFRMQRKTLLQSTFWIKFILYRYIRIVPIYFLFHWFLQDAFRFLGAGPLWDYGTSHSAWSHYCTHESAWTVLLPQANFKSPAIHCDGVGWYLANDIQFAFITPIFVVAYAVWPLAGHLLAGSSVLVIMANHIYYYFNVAQDKRSVFEWNHMSLTTVLDDTSDGYVNPQYRVLAYIIGIAAGYVMVERHSRPPKTASEKSVGQSGSDLWPRSFVLVGKAFVFFTVYLLCSTPYVSSMLPLDNKQLIHVLASVFQGLHHGTTSVAAALFVILLCSGHFPWVAKLFRWNVFKVLANASLTTLLVHIPIIFYHSQSITTLPELTPYYFASVLIVYGIESYLLSILVHLVYELPIRRFLVKLLLNLFADNNSVTKLRENGATSQSGKSDGEATSSTNKAKQS